MEKKPIKLTRPVAMQLIRGAVGCEVEVEILSDRNPDVYLAYTPALAFECSVNFEFGVYELRVSPIGGVGDFRMFFDVGTHCRRICTEYEADRNDMTLAVSNWLFANEPEAIRARYQELRGEEL